MTKDRILVVDDEEVERQTLVEILRMEGYLAAGVPNGEAALEHLRANPVDLIILDLRMPGMSGLDVIKAVSRIAPDLEIILLTAHGSMDSAIEALRQRVHDYILKPAPPAAILASVERGLAHRQARLRSAGGALDGDEEILPITLENGSQVDFSRRLILQDDQVISLTPAEGRLLKVLMDNPGKVIVHRDLVLLVQGYAASLQEAPEILRPLVSRLRQKLEQVPALKDRVVSVRGAGYLYEPGDLNPYS